MHKAFFKFCPEMHVTYFIVENVQCSLVIYSNIAQTAGGTSVSFCVCSPFHIRVIYKCCTVHTHISIVINSMVDMS